MNWYRGVAYLLLMFLSFAWSGATKATTGQLVGVGLFVAAMLLLGTTPSKPPK